MTSSTTCARAATSASIGSLRRNRSPSRSLAPLQRLAERADGASVAAERLLECAAVDQRRRAAGASSLRIAARQPRSAGPSVSTSKPVVRDEHRVLPLRGQRVILRHDGPAVREQLHVALAGVDHRLDREGHAGHELDAGAGPAVVQHLRILVEDPADAVAAVLAHDREALLLDEALDRVADVAEAAPGWTARMPRHIASKHTRVRRSARIDGSPTKNMRLVSPW